MFVIYLSLSVLALGGFMALVLMRSPRMASFAAAGSTVLGCSMLLAPIISVLLGGEPRSAFIEFGHPFFSWNLKMDALAAFFSFPISILSICAAIYGVGYLRHSERSQNTAVAWCWFNLLVASMILVVLAQNAVLFLLAWEATALTSFFLVAFEHDKEENRKAAWIYLIASHLGTACIIILFLLLGKEAGSYDFDRFHLASQHAGGFITALFLLSAIGFGTKAGFVPLHVWLPEAHPAAPSHVSALMSGVMIKAGIYGILRVLTFFPSFQIWWGWFFIILGISSGVIGVLYALAQHDLKRLLAYHSVENIGIISLGIGTGIMGICAQRDFIAVAGFAGALLHVLNHAVFKGLLFLGAGSVVHATGTRQIDALGGLLRKMPVTGATFLIGSMSISGLPPFNGFVSEFLIYSAAFAGLLTKISWLMGPAALVIVGLAFIGGLAAACFSKVFSILFLGFSRGKGLDAEEAGIWMRVPMIVLALLCASIAVCAPAIIGSLSSTIGMLGRLSSSAVAAQTSVLYYPLLIVVIATAAFVLLVGLIGLLRARLLRGRTVGETVTWDCGYVKPSASMQYTAASYAEPLITLFAPFLRRREKVEGISGYFPAHGEFVSHTPDLFRKHLFTPLFSFVENSFAKLAWIQPGVIQVYVLYIALTVIFLLLLEFI